MPVAIDTNQSSSLDVIGDLDMNLDTFIQTILSPIYNAFPALSKTIFGIPLGNLLAAVWVLFLFVLLRRFFTNIVINGLQKLAQHSKTYYDNRIISALKNPFGFAFIIIGLHLFFALIFKETHIIKNILNSMIIYNIFWALIAISGVVRDIIRNNISHYNSNLSKEMSDFILRIVQFFIGGIGFGAILEVWGINVTALLASLGLGGLAFALAAKDTASNLFGSFAILADKSIRIGEWIKVDGVEGVVEEIGMRTTKIRSFEKSLITLPNQILANTPIENFSRRGVRRIKMRLGLTYGINSQQIHKIVEEIKYMLHSHPNIATEETLLVNFKSFGDSALNIFIYTFTSTANWEKYLNIREDVHLQIMKIVEENNASFAFPSQSIYVESLPS